MVPKPVLGSFEHLFKAIANEAESYLEELSGRAKFNIARLGSRGIVSIEAETKRKDEELAYKIELQKSRAEHGTIKDTWDELLKAIKHAFNKVLDAISNCFGTKKKEGKLEEVLNQTVNDCIEDIKGACKRGLSSVQACFLGAQQEVNKALK